MKMLLLSSAYNSLTQHAHVALNALQHKVAVVVAITPEAMAEAVDRVQPDLILCPMLTRIIPCSIWEPHPCIILHPGIIGDRGAASLDWAILNDEPTWGATGSRGRGTRRLWSDLGHQRVTTSHNSRNRFAASLRSSRPKSSSQG
jgi:hypothetical protein